MALIINPSIILTPIGKDTSRLSSVRYRGLYAFYDSTSSVRFVIISINQFYVKCGDLKKGGRCHYRRYIIIIGRILVILMGFFNNKNIQFYMVSALSYLN